MNLRLILFLILSAVCFAANPKLYEFPVGNCIVSTGINNERVDTSFQISFRILEERIAKELIKAGLTPQPGEKKFVYFEGTKLHINAIYDKLVHMSIELDGRFYQLAKQKDKQTINIDFKVSFSKKHTSFLGRLTDFLTLPVGMIFESILNIAFATSSQQLSWKDYMDFKMEGDFDPLMFFKKLGISIINLFLPDDMAVATTHTGQITVKPGKLAMEYINGLQYLEIGAMDQGILVQIF